MFSAKTRQDQRIQKPIPAYIPKDPMNIYALQGLVLFDGVATQCF